MKENPEKPSLFSLDALHRARLRIFGIFEPTDLEDPSRRQFLGQAAGLAASAALPGPAVKLLSGGMPTDIASAVESFLDRYARPDRSVLYFTLSTGVVQTVTPIDDALQRLTCPEYRLFRPHPALDARFPLRPNADEAIAAAQSVLDERRAYQMDCAFFNRFILRHPDQMDALAAAIEAHPDYKKWSGDRTVRQELDRSLQHFSSEEKLEEFEAMGNYRDYANQFLYQRFNRLLPGTTEEEKKEVLKRIKSDLDDEGLLESEVVSLTIRRSGYDHDFDGNSTPSYFLELQYPANCSREGKSYYYHDMIAGLEERFPCTRMLFNDRTSALPATHPGRLTITPTDDGLHVTFPAHWQETQLAALRDHFDTQIKGKTTLQRSMG